MGPKNRVERRKHRRYIVRGRVKFTIDSLDLWADLVNFGEGGMLIRSRYEIPAGTLLHFRVIAYCYPNTFEVQGQIVGGRDSLLAIQFLSSTSGTRELLQWLEGEHFPWTGGSSSEDFERVEAWQNARPVNPLGTAETPDSLEVIFQDA
jgi:PilZ domain